MRGSGGRGASTCTLVKEAASFCHAQSLHQGNLMVTRIGLDYAFTFFYFFQFVRHVGLEACESTIPILVFLISQFL